MRLSIHGWLSGADAHGFAAFGAAMMVPTLGVVPVVLVLRRAGGAATADHLAWAAGITSALMLSAAFLGSALPDGLALAGPAWSESAWALRNMGAVWMMLAFCAPVMLSVAHGLAACVGLLRRARLARPVRLRRPSPPKRAPAPFPVEAYPTERVLLAVYSTTLCCRLPRLLTPSMTAVPCVDTN